LAGPVRLAFPGRLDDGKHGSGGILQPADRPYGLSVAARTTVPPARSVAATAASVSATAK